MPNLIPLRLIFFLGKPRLSGTGSGSQQFEALSVRKPDPLAAVEFYKNIPTSTEGKRSLLLKGKTFQSREFEKPHPGASFINHDSCETVLPLLPSRKSLSNRRWLGFTNLEGLCSHSEFSLFQPPNEMTNGSQQDRTGPGQEAQGPGSWPDGWATVDHKTCKWPAFPKPFPLPILPSLIWALNTALHPVTSAGLLHPAWLPPLWQLRWEEKLPKDPKAYYEMEPGATQIRVPSPEEESVEQRLRSPKADEALQASVLAGAICSPVWSVNSPF